MDPLTLIELSPFLVIAGVAAREWWRNRNRPPRLDAAVRADLGALARDQGLAFEGDDRHPNATLVGSYRGYAITARVEALGGVPHGWEMPHRVTIEATPRALHPPEAPLAPAPAHGVTVTWRALTLVRRSVHPLPILRLLDEAVGLLRPLDEAALEPWRAVGRACGLRAFDPTRSGLPPLAGERDGVRVDAEPRGMRPGVSWRVTAVPPDPAPGLLVRPSEGAPGGLRTNNPLFDRFLLAEGPAHLAPWLADPDRAALILGALGEHPLSTIRDGAVTLVAPATTPEALGALLDEAVCLARALDGPPPALGGPASV